MLHSESPPFSQYVIMNDRPFFTYLQAGSCLLHRKDRVQHISQQSKMRLGLADGDRRREGLLDAFSHPGSCFNPHQGAPGSKTSQSRISAKHPDLIGSRSLDLLHVAAALEAKATHFASLDTRQLKVDILNGLKILPG